MTVFATGLKDTDYGKSLTVDKEDVNHSIEVTLIVMAKPNNYNVGKTDFCLVPQKTLLAVDTLTATYFSGRLILLRIPAVNKSGQLKKQQKKTNLINNVTPN